MKKLFLISLLIFVTNIYSQWLDGALYPDFRVNTDSTVFIQDYSSIGVDSQGNFVITWNNLKNLAQTNGQVYCQIFDKFTNRINGNFGIGQDTCGAGQISVLKNGEFSITWATSKNFSGNWRGYYVWAQKFNSDGNPLTGFIQVNDTTFYSIGNKSISTDSLGNFVIVWESYLTSLSKDIYGQRFDSSGNKIGQNFKVNTENHRASLPSVSENGSGSFSIVWGTDSVNAIKIRHYNNNGIPLGLEQKVDDDVTNALKGASMISTTRGGYSIITWADYRNYGTLAQIYYQIIDSLGNTIGNNRYADELTGEIKNSPRCSMRENGYSIIIWNDNRMGKLIPYAQRLDSIGNKIGSNFIIPVYTNFANSGIESCYLFGDRIYSTWSDNRNGGQNYDVFCNIRSFQNPDSILSIIGNKKNIINNFKLYNPYPSPFNSTTRIDYQIPKNNYIRLSVYDILGNEIKILANGRQEAGFYSVRFNADNLSSGVYFIKFFSESGYNETKKIVLIK